ncbi:acyl-CoA dehydrogenase family protein [Fulvivirga lutea]|uniref:Acyl-CoA dehydrogenase family protein n=1 Tax=Fulvivirga lutea TaxID=2810512 RepID=A0A974WGF7_9BACT|nr:acyl-CoA dehydrogenase family protein [Fulvivirga lutea]QSE97590.1 acyl-CoA dehydrogenase family protein [Fulvivirga lutea]
MNFNPSEKSQEYLKKLKTFMKANVYPFEKEWAEFNKINNPDSNWKQWIEHPKLKELKTKARSEGLWNLFLPDSELGEGLSVLDYAPLAEEMGRIYNSAEIFNCNAPDTGNMEVLYHFGSKQQKEKWLKPLLNGEIKSVFCMTEPDVASSDATNIETSIAPDGDEIVINGKKWWSTGLGHPEAQIAIVMGKTSGLHERHKQHSMVLVPLNSTGVEIKRMLPTFGAYDAPAGHGEVYFNNVRVPKENIIMDFGAGFAIAQGRLGPGRIHHCMRCIGAAERALELAIIRSGTREAFGKPLAKLGGNAERFAKARVAIDQARLLTHYAAWKIDQFGIKESMTEISAIKVVAPQVLQEVTDMAMQIHGGGGLSDDFPLSSFFLQARALRLADGPDEVHLGMISRLEFKKYLS